MILIMAGIWKYSAVMLCLSVAECCRDPEINVRSYSTTEDALSTKTLFIAQFVLNCRDGPHPSMLYAEVGNRPLLPAKSNDDLTFQVSWSDEHDKIKSGMYTVKVYDESQYSSMRKAQRSAEATDHIKPLATIDLHHNGVSKGPWISSETAVCFIALGMLYMAYSTKKLIVV